MATVEIARPSRSPYGNLWIVLALLIPAVLLAFAPTYFKGVTVSRPVTALVHLHTALMVLWVLLLISQAWLISPSSIGFTGGSEGRRSSSYRSSSS